MCLAEEGEGLLLCHYGQLLFDGKLFEGGSSQWG